MLLFLLLFGLALGAVPPSDDSNSIKLQRGTCPMFWYTFNDRCYKYVSARLSWAEAELFCLSEGANLVSIHNLEEQKFVRSLIENFDHTEGHTWIGLSDIHKEDRWMWSDGCPVSFVFWSAGEPDNDVEEHCAHINYEPDMKWNDMPCAETFPSVCATRITCP